jgi:SAM-dependent methyltransferase
MRGNTMLSSTERFSSRVDDYVKYRPSYPAEVIALLQSRCELTRSSVVADVGSGTGILTELLLTTGATVFAVEPNREMRGAAERLLHQHANFRSIDGTAEATTLSTASVDLVVAAQAFHWFDPHQARQEFMRVLKPARWVALIWNERPLVSNPFLDTYETLLRKYAPEYDQVTSQRVDEERIRQFFAGSVELTKYGIQQQFDFAGLKGRLMSSSYAPQFDSPLHEPLLAGLRGLFDHYQQRGKVIFPYQTLVYFGRLT